MGSLSIVSLLALGFVLGLKHAVDADHLAAVSTIASERRSLFRSSLVGALWGLGHTLALMVAGIAVIVLHFQISQRTTQALEFCVGLMHIVVFGIGSIGGMMVMSTLFALPARFTANRFSRTNFALRGLAGLFSLSFGLFMVYEIGFVDHLLR